MSIALQAPSPCPDEARARLGAGLSDGEFRERPEVGFWPLAQDALTHHG